MGRFTFYPEWFLGIDHTFEFISMITCFLLAFFAFKSYRLTEKDSYQRFSFAFGAMGFSFLFKILSTLATHVPFVQAIKTVPGIATGVVVLQTIGWSHVLTFMVHQGLMMIGFFILLVMIWKIKNKSLIFLFGYLTILTLMLGYYYYHVLPLTLALLTGFIYNHYRLLCAKTKNKNVRLVSLSFLFIFIAQIILLFVRYRSMFYVAAEAIQLGGFLILLWLYIKLLRR